MIYALCGIGMEYGDQDGVLEFATLDEAREDFRAAVRRHPPRSIAERWLFTTREQAEQANLTTADEVDVDESLASGTLEFERGYGFNF